MTAQPRVPDVASVFAAAKAYNANLQGRNVLLLGRDKRGNVDAIELTFRKQNFRHLIGVRTKDSAMSANDFFDRCIDQRLSAHDLLPDRTGNARLKLAVAKRVFQRDLSATEFGSANSSRLLVRSDKVAGSKIGTIGFMRDQSGRLLPSTLLNANIRNETVSPYKVVAAFNKPIGQKGYGKPIRMANDEIDWDSILERLPRKFSKLELGR